ncbi:Putative elongation factor TypA-like SVR3, chloroplastic [Linum perenne]
MAMAAFRREGRRFAGSLTSPQPMSAIRSALILEEQVPLGVRSISTQIVRNRMKSVKNIQKITKAMKMVAASKLRAIQTKTENSRGLWQPFTALLGDTPAVDVKKNIVVTVSSDKGLCGGINSTSVKISRAIYKLSSGPEKEVKYVILGEKAKAQLLRDSKKDIELSISELQKNPLNYTQVAVIADDILKNVEYDALRIVFNKFQSVVSFLPTMSTVLSPEIVEREAEAGGSLGELDSYEIEGGETKGEILQNLAEFQFSCVMFNAVLENACSEQGARMSAMDSSSRNAGDMLDRLTLTYNRTRQASITTELTEIISGASALEEEKKSQLMRRSDIRNIAIVAHVDHGKTTLVDSMLRQAKDTKINIIDTPGHSDFGGEVERILNMVEGVLLVVDSVEGPMPQTRFVLKKALEFGHAVVVVVNKIDRSSARPDYVINSTFELFIELNASDEQCDFQAIYAIGIQGKAGLSPDDLADDLGPLFESVIRCIPGPLINKDGALQMLATNLEYDEHKGRVAIGRVHAGVMRRGMEVRVCTSEDSCRFARLSELFVYEKFYRVPVDSVEAGDICAACGIEDIQIGETIADKALGKPLPSIKVEEPTVKMAFSINTSPFVGKEGKYVTSRNLRDRLYRELERNLAMKVEDGETSDTFVVSGRGTLHITILIENMRREGYEFMVGPPKVINKRGPDDKLLEPFEIATVEVPEEHQGAVMELLGKRRGQITDMQGVGSEGTTLLKYRVPTRGLLGLRNAILTASRGTAILNTIFDGYGPWAGDISTRDQGSLVAFEDGTSTSYAMASSQERGQLFIGPGADVYKGQIVGIHQRTGDLGLNVCKKKAATNVRSNKEVSVVLDTPLDYSLDDCIEYIQEDELVEVTPANIRMCKNPKYSKKGSR